MKFVKGQSGNPNGRPKRGHTMADSLKKILGMKDPATGRPNRELVAEMLILAARQGNVLAIREIFDRIDGKALQAMELTGKDGSPLVRILVVDGEAAQLTERIVKGEQI